MYINNSAPNTNFGNFKKITGTPKQLKQMSSQIPAKYLTILEKENPKESSLYLFSGKHYNKMVKALKNRVCLFEIIEDAVKHIGEKPKKLSYNKALEQVKKGKL